MRLVRAERNTELGFLGLAPERCRVLPDVPGAEDRRRGGSNVALLQAVLRRRNGPGGREPEVAG